MKKLTDAGMALLGGTTRVAELVKAPVSTVHSWKRSGISESRLHHLKLATQAEGIVIDWDVAVEDMAEHDEGLTVPETTASPGKNTVVTAVDGGVSAARSIA